jgi:hypothetical protein
MHPKANPSRTGTACLIGKAGLLEPVLKRSPAPSRFPRGAKTSQMDVYIPYIPKYKISRPKFPPNVCNSEHNHPPTTSGIIYIYLPVSPTPHPTVPPYYTPPPSYPAPSASQPPTRSPKRTLLVILTSHGTTATRLFSLFFGWWVVASIDKSTLWDQYQVSCIRVAARGDLNEVNQYQKS